MFDNLKAPVPEEEVENLKKEIVKVVSCGDSPDCVKRIIVPSSLENWKDRLIHGGMIEFDSQESMVRALIYAQGQVVKGDDPIALQIPTLLNSRDKDIAYDLSTEEGAIRVLDDSSSESADESLPEDNQEEQDEIMRLLAGGM
jgi:hypothetical protein